MFGLDVNMLAFIGLAAVSAGLILYAILYTAIERDKKTSQRMKSLQTDPKTKAAKQARQVDEKTRRKMREDALKTIDSQRDAGKAATSPPLSMRITQAGLTISTKQFYAMSLGLGAAVFAFAFLLTPASLLVAGGAAFAATVGLPLWILNFIRAKRFRQFILAFPNAVDVIVRGVRSGLPLNDCLRIIANDSEEPVKSEFRKVIEATQLGINTPEAVGRLYDSIPTSETNFFAIVIAIQSQAGGNLSEALGNLSKVLRERRKMSDKIKAVSSEAKWSAIIIGSLPFVVAGLVSLTTPGYMDALFETSSGHKVLFFCALSMGGGILIMKKMINFKF